MVFMHPVCLLISLISALFYSRYLNGGKATRFHLRFILPMMIMAALINPAFSHEGVTILCYLPTGNPLTLESIIYGIAAAAMLAAVMCWFSCYTAVMTSDKFVYLFGRVIPALSLVLSMTLRFVPRLRAQARVISNAQRCVGRDVSDGSIIERARHGMTILSILTTWSLENAVETADSMRSRGYGLPGRTAFSIYKIEKRDRQALLFLGACAAVIIGGSLAGGLYWRYYPSIRGGDMPWLGIVLFAFYAALCLMPVIINRAADRRWAAITKSAGKETSTDGTGSYAA